MRQLPPLEQRHLKLSKHAELEARIALLDQVEAASKEAERVRLTAECATAAAVSKVYEDAIKEDI